MYYVDLDEVAVLVDAGILSPGRFRAADHKALAPPACSPEQAVSLAERVRNFVEDQAGVQLRGAVRLLTQLRQLGYYFSPLNLYYCFDDEGQLQAVVAEVSNTPWREQHLYVLWAGNSSEASCGSQRAYSHAKAFHVSPFMPMQIDYDWKVSVPAETLQVSITNREAHGETFFAATMNLTQRPLTRAQTYCNWRRYSCMSARIISRIYWQALKLWWKQCPYYPHPQASPTIVKQ